MSVRLPPQVNYYRLQYNDSWCIISFGCNDSVASDRILGRLLLHDVICKKISWEVFLRYNLKFFASFRVGAIRFDVGSRDLIRYSDFFSKFLIDRYERCDENTIESIYPGFFLSLSSKEADI